MKQPAYSPDTNLVDKFIFRNNKLNQRFKHFHNFMSYVCGILIINIFKVLFLKIFRPILFTERIERTIIEDDRKLIEAVERTRM